MVNSEQCIGCQSCVEICPTNAITFIYDMWGEGRVLVEANKCVDCKICEMNCPNIKLDLFPAPQKVYAAVSKNNAPTGSSGGVFYELAKVFIDAGGIVYGAAFDENQKLIHTRASSLEELMPICKSKYLHSDMTGVYTSIKSDLESGKKVMFVGTPCQSSAAKNLFYQKYSESFTVLDFLCHGTGTQKVFDMCIHSEEIKRGGKISNFQFRSKSRKAEHSFTYELSKNNKTKKVSGYAFEFPFYYSYLKYTIFNDVCYSCKYAANTRVGDITLGDFWKIQKYNDKLFDQNGVSMISVNSDKGKKLLDTVRQFCDLYEYPIEFASSHNQSFNEPVTFPQRKNELREILSKSGEDALMKSLSCPNVKKNLIYARIPKNIKKLYNFLRGR